MKTHWDWLCNQIAVGMAMRALLVYVWLLFHFGFPFWFFCVTCEDFFVSSSGGGGGDQASIPATGGVMNQ